MDVIKLEIEVDEKLDSWPVLCQLNDDHRFVERAYCSKGVLTVYVLKDLTPEAIFELGFNAGMKFVKK